MRVPMIHFDDAIMAEAKASTINRRRVPRAKGLDMTRNIERWIGSSEGGGMGSGL